MISRAILILSLVLPCNSIAQNRCDASSLKLGATRDSVVSELQQLTCNVRLGTPKDGIEDDLITNPGDDKVWYYEVIFLHSRLAAVWTYSKVYTSADDAFMALFNELV